MSLLPGATAAPTEVRLNERDYKIGPLKMRTLGRVQAWLDAQDYPDPVEELKALKDDLDPDLYRAEMIEAYNRKRAGRQLVMGGGYDLIARSSEGRVLFFREILKERQPGLADEEVREAFDDCTPALLTRIFLIALGMPPDALDPKGPEPASASNGVGSSG